jgi:hypothetical protein
MAWIENIWIVDHNRIPIKVDSIVDRIALYLLSNWLSVVPTSQLRTQEKALRLLFDNAEKIVGQQHMVAEFVKNNPINEDQISVLNELVFWLHALGLFIEILDFSDDEVSLVVLHDGGKMKLNISADGTIHTSFTQDGRTSMSLLKGWMPTDHSPSLDVYLAREFGLYQ